MDLKHIVEREPHNWTQAEIADAVVTVRHHAADVFDKWLERHPLVFDKDAEGEAKQ